MKYPEKIPVKEPKDLTPPELKPFEIKKVEVPPPPPLHLKVSWLEILTGLFRKSAEDDLNELNKGGRSQYLPILLASLKQNWTAVAIGLGVIILAYLGFRIFG